MAFERLSDQIGTSCGIFRTERFSPSLFFRLWIEKDQKLDAFYSQQSPRELFPGNQNRFIWEVS